MIYTNIVRADILLVAKLCSMLNHHIRCIYTLNDQFILLSSYLMLWLFSVIFVGFCSFEETFSFWALSVLSKTKVALDAGSLG